MEKGLKKQNIYELSIFFLIFMLEMKYNIISLMDLIYFTYGSDVYLTFLKA